MSSAAALIIFPAIAYIALAALGLALCRVAAIGDQQTIVDERRGEQ